MTRTIMSSAAELSRPMSPSSTPPPNRGANSDHAPAAGNQDNLDHQRHHQCGGRNPCHHQQTFWTDLIQTGAANWDGWLFLRRRRASEDYYFNTSLLPTRTPHPRQRDAQYPLGRPYDWHHHHRRRWLCRRRFRRPGSTAGSFPRSPPTMCSLSRCDDCARLSLSTNAPPPTCLSSRVNRTGPARMNGRTFVTASSHRDGTAPLVGTAIRLG